MNAKTSLIPTVEKKALAQIRAVFDLVAADAADMSEEHLRLLDASRPTPEQIPTDRWDDDAGSPG